MYKPNTVQFELSEGCNRHCSFCGTTGFKGIKFIDLRVLKKQAQLVEESGYKPRVALVGHGEPTLHPHFFTCVKVMRKQMPDLYFQMMTNGYLIHKDLHNITRIFDAGVNDIILDEYSDNKFDRDAIQEILDQYTADTGRKVEFNKMKEDKCSLYGPKNPRHYRLLIVDAIDEAEISMSRKLTNHCGAGMPIDTSMKDKRCTRLFRELIYRADGKVCLCCQDFRGEYEVCDMTSDSIQKFDDMWLHPRMEAARKITYHDGRTFYPCNICNLIPIRPGLLPDYKGQEDMPKPTKEDYDIVNKRSDIMATRVPRPWEIEAGQYVNGDPIN